MAYETVLFDVVDRVATITLNRPKRLNAYNPVMREELRQCWTEVKENPDIWVAVITGAGRAFSGGADSTFLLASALRLIEGRVLGVTARSPAYASREAEHAEATAHILSAEHIFIDSAETEDPSFRANPPDRCYYCKRTLFAELQRLARREGITGVADGTTADELRGHRPGARAARELGILSPLAAAGLTKADVRQLGRKYGVPNFDRPQMACLASRFPYGEEITPAKLQAVEAAEDALAELGFRQVRCRRHGPVARVEVAAAELKRALTPDLRQRIAERLHELGFLYVTLDLDGYRPGSMAEAFEAVTP